MAPKLDPFCQPIEVILSDVDGVLTDGCIQFDNQGIESKSFHVRDGLAIKLWQQAGYKFGLITARSSQIVRMRSAELGIEVLRQGVENKLTAAREIMQEFNVEPSQVCYIGDDLPDLAVVQSVGLGVAVADAAVEVVDAARYTTKAKGGQAAIRELVELVLKSKQRWTDLISRFHAT